MAEFNKPWESMKEKQMVKFDLEKILLEGIQPNIEHLKDREVWWSWYDNGANKTFVLRMHNSGLYEAIDMSRMNDEYHRITLSTNLIDMSPPFVEDNIYEILSPEYDMCKIIQEKKKKFEEFDTARKYFMDLCDSYGG